MIKRLTNEFELEIRDAQLQVVIVTSDEAENREFESSFLQGASVFYGSPNNIPLRHLQAAKELGLEYIVSIDGDDILCSVVGARSVYESLKSGSKYAKTSSLPLGMNSAGYTTSFLEESLIGFHGDLLETGWGRIFDSKELLDIDMRFCTNNESLRFTLDYKMDFVFFKVIIEALGERIFTASDKEIVELVSTKEIYKLNESISKEYWQNFRENVAKEKSQK